MFSLINLVICSIFMSILLLVMELWQFSFIRDWEIRNTPFGVLLNIDWDQLGTPNLTWMFLVKATECFKIPGNSFYCFWVIKGRVWRKITPIPSRIGLRFPYMMCFLIVDCFDITTLDVALFSVECSILRYCSI